MTSLAATLRDLRDRYLALHESKEDLFWSSKMGLTADVEADDMDGLTVSHWAASGDGPRWWFNVRPSNTEPLLRLNVEAADRSVMEDVRDLVLRVMRAEG